MKFYDFVNNIYIITKSAFIVINHLDSKLERKKKNLNEEEDDDDEENNNT